MRKIIETIRCPLLPTWSLPSTPWANKKGSMVMKGAIDEKNRLKKTMIKYRWLLSMTIGCNERKEKLTVYM
jgi:hypothetical protein